MKPNFKFKKFYYCQNTHAIGFEKSFSQKNKWHPMDHLHKNLKFLFFLKSDFILDTISPKISFFGGRQNSSFFIVNYLCLTILSISVFVFALSFALA